MHRLKNLRLEVGLISLIALVSLLLVASGWQTLHDHRYYIDAEIRINRINEQLRALNLTFSAFQDAEIGQRGYLLTQDRSYLEPYENALNTIENRIDWLESGMAHEPNFKPYLSEIKQIKAEKFEELQQTIELNDGAGRQSALEIVRSDRGKEIMDRLRVLIGEMLVAKRGQLAAIKLASLQQARDARWSTYAFGGSIGLFMLLAYAFLVFDLHERSRLKARAEFAENHDPLTGLYNRRFFLELLANQLKHTYREGARCALLFIDINNFKAINDEFGFIGGNQVLIEVGDRLQETARKRDPVSHLHNDEFAILVSHVVSVEELAAFANRLMDALTPSLIPGMPEKYLGVSIGIAVYPDDAHSTSELLRCANQAVRQAKAEDGIRYRFYSSLVRPAPSRGEVLTSGLHRAVERQEFSLHFQPQVDAGTQKIVGVEALVRWNHPELGPISPEEFIPIAEKTGLILPLGVWILREACMQVHRWNQQGMGLDLAVNVSAAELIGEDFFQVLSDALAWSGLPAQRLEIEITERALMNERAAQELQRIRQLGVRVSIDDFGTGYSSLSYLTRLSFDALKIDKLFIGEIPGNRKDCGMVKTIIHIGKELGVRIVAEGVETREQAQFLRQHGCDLGQGYLFSKPVAADEMANLMRAAGQAAS